jgi:hypothetical protein
MPTQASANGRHPKLSGPRGTSSALLAAGLFALGCGHSEPPPAEAPAPPVAAPASTAAAPSPEPAMTPAAAPAEDPKQFAAGFHEFFMHDECTGQYPPQPDTCAHLRKHEKSFTFGGKPGTVYDVTLHIRGIFEPTIIKDGQTPYPQHPYFKVGGTVDAIDWSHWHIEVSEPKQTYWLNHYPKFSHTIYKEDYEATIQVAGGATVVIRVIDGNDRQIDNGKTGPDRQQIIAGVVDKALAGQMLRLDVVSVKAR